MISKIEVKELFGVFNHEIPLNDQGITLVLGQNGLGKTIILKLVKSFFESNFLELRDNIFKELRLTFLDNTVLSIKRGTEKNNHSLLFEHLTGKKKNPTYEFNATGKHKASRYGRERDFYMDEFIYRNRKDYNRLHNDEIGFLIERFSPIRVERIGVDQWVSHHENTMYTTNDLISTFEDYFPHEIREKFGKGIPSWLSELAKSVKIKLIETQRLLTPFEEGKYRSAVTNYSNQLVQNIKDKRSESTDLGSNLDRTYPTRVIEEIAKGTLITNEFIQESFVALQKKRALLNDVGLLDTEEGDLQVDINQAFDQKILKEVLRVYIEDSNKKLAIYDDLSLRIKLLLDIINKRFTYKKLSIDKNKGFVFTSGINKKEIPLSGLSSGEQHELVLYYELLFNTQKNSLLLIDEPEISLHISWQKQFINDLTSVTTLNNLSVIIATHSPDIIGNNWPLCVQLNGAS